MNEITPFVKWAGGKGQLLDRIKDRMPHNYNRYYEPFVGGGAVLLGLQPKIATISDMNKQLIYTYYGVRDEVDKIIEQIDKMDKLTTKEYYYQVREEYNQMILNNVLDTKMATHFIWLNKHCYNGLYRVNSKGLFNVPYNNKKNGSSINVDNMRKLSAFLKKVEIYNQDFEKTVMKARENDFVYFDPPYVPLKEDGFIDYTETGFGIKENERLAKVYKELSAKGVYVMLSNHNVDLIKKLYKDFNIEVVGVKRMINSNSSDRNGEEVIITNYETGI